MQRIFAISVCACLLAMPCLATATPPAKSAHPAAKHKQQSQTSHHRWQRMTPEQRSHVKERAREFKRMNPEQRQRVRKAYRYYQSLPPGEREHLRKQWQKNPHHKRQNGRDIGPATPRRSHEHQRRPRLNQRQHTQPHRDAAGRHTREQPPSRSPPDSRSKPHRH